MINDFRLASGANTAPTNELVPLELPPARSVPNPAHDISLLRGLFTMWLRPRRIGPDLVQSAMWRAVIVNVLATCFAVFCVGGTITFRFTPGGQSTVSVREVLGNWIMNAAMYSATSPWGWPISFGTFAAIPLECLALMLIGSVLSPLAAAGDSPRSVWKRAVKASLWSSTVIAPAAVLWAMGYLVLTRSASLPPDYYRYSVWPQWTFVCMDGMSSAPMEICAIAITILLYARAFSGGISRYVGPPVGPGFQPREPRCWKCGYRLVGLRRDGACPECGTNVQLSLDRMG